jgi:thioredoxin reductase (NADPH)
MMSEVFDIIIIGGGPSGLSAGMYCTRAGFNTLLIEKIGTGGQLMLTDLIDNYPGFHEGITGFDLQERLKKQAIKFGLNITYDSVKGIEKKDSDFFISTSEKQYTAKSVIIASGAKHKELGVKGEKEFAARGVSYCGTCDGPFFKDKNVVVIGGGDTALTEAIYVSKFVKNLTIIHRKDRFRAVCNLVNKIENIPAIGKSFNSVITEIKGDNKVRSVIIKDIVTQETREIETDGVFIFIGIIPNSDFINLPILDNEKFVITNNKMETSIEGLFACGDIRSNAFRQIVCAASDGATAANYAGEYINFIKGCKYI